MDKQKDNVKNYGTAYYAMAFLAAFFFEFYWIMTNPYEYFMLIGTGIIMIIMGYLTIDSILKAKADNDALKAEQNEMMLKAQKAIYIATKKNSKDTEYRQIQSIKAVELMMNKMISSQQALLEDKKPAADDMSSLIDQLSASNAKLAKEVQSAITVNQLVKANADLVRNVKEALSSANSNIVSGDLSSYVSQAIGEDTAPRAAVNSSPVQTAPDTASPLAAEASFATETPFTAESSFAAETPFAAEAPFTAETPFASETILNSSPADSATLNAFDMSEMQTDAAMDSNTMSAIENEINLAEMAASEALEEMTIPDEMTAELDAAMTDVTSGDIPSDAATPFAAAPDDSPNRQMTEEEIAALFAGL